MILEKFLKKLLAKFPDILDYRSANLYSFVHTLIMNDCNETLDLVFNQFPNKLTNLNSDHYNILQITIIRKKEKLALDLIERFPQFLTEKCSLGYTPIHDAALMGMHTVILAILTNQPERLHDITYNSHTILHLAIDNKHEDLRIKAKQRVLEYFTLQAREKKLLPLLRAS